jgi:TPR repeat protein
MKLLRSAWVLFLIVGFVTACGGVPVQAGSESSTLEDLIQQAEAGDKNAQFSLGYLYYTGKEVDQDLEKAFEWYSRSAEQGYEQAQSRLGDMYEIGRGVPQNLPAAFIWYRKAAAQGFEWAQFKLGLFYHTGRSVPTDYQQAFTWYTKAAEQGNIYAQCALAGMYMDGTGVEQNRVYAYAWSSLAAEAGNKEAAKYKNMAAEKLSPQQLIRARELAMEFQYRIEHPGTLSARLTSRARTTITIEPLHNPDSR